ncbi:hypothetical protein ACFXAZ_01525 [Streptomyces sp. NPDC059477]|uniref:hypothetical protein n=1 Tax=Streptomyces sp. NPDC059477 TaxID=3346847 RepID=UPI003689E960
MATGRGRTTAGRPHAATPLTPPPRTTTPASPTPPRTTAAITLTLLTATLLTGCATPTPRAAPTPGATSTPETTPAPTPPADLCARLISHWSRELLATDTYGDYQSMGLSNGQYAILMDVVDAARTELTRQGRAAAEKLLDRLADERCAARYRDGNPTSGPWS